MDDSTIADDDPLWRRVPPRHFTIDKQTGHLRPASAAFDDHFNGSPMSVVLGSLVLDRGGTPEDILAPFPGYGLVSFTAGLARTLGLSITRAPLPDEPAHAEVSGKKTRAVMRALAKGSVWLIPPPTSMNP